MMKMKTYLSGVFLLILAAAVLAKPPDFEVLFQNATSRLLGLGALINRFEAVDRCRDTHHGQLVGARPQVLTASVRAWLFGSLTSFTTEKEPAFHLDVYLDNSLLGFEFFRYLDGFPFKGSLEFEHRGIIFNTTYGAYDELPTRQTEIGVALCEVGPCGSGNWLYLDKVCYHLGPRFVQQAYTWSQAQRYCRAKGADLFVPGSAEELAAVSALLEPLHRDVYVYLGFARSGGVWEGVKASRGFRPNIGGPDEPSYNVSALFRPAASPQQARLVAFTDSTQFLNGPASFVVLFVCQKNIQKCGAFPMLNYTTLNFTLSAAGYEEVRYECVRGYERLRGDAVRYCTAEGVWSGNDLECTRKSCGKAQIPESAVIIGQTFRSPAERYFYGDQLVVSCKPGYRNAAPSAVLSCTENGTWSHEIRCERPQTGCNTSLARPSGGGNVRLSEDSFQAQYTCDAGLELFYGVETRFCSKESLEWSGIEPVCEKVFKCPAGLFNYGPYCLDFRRTSAFALAELTALCQPLQLFASAEAVLDLRAEIARNHLRHAVLVNASDGRARCFDTWSPTAPGIALVDECSTPAATVVCSARRSVECPAELVYQIANSNFSDARTADEYGAYAVSFAPSARFDVDAEVVFSCKSGYRVASDGVNTSRIRCQSSGQWIGLPVPFRCVPVRCPFAEVKNGLCAGDTLVGSRLVCSCDSGFSLNVSAGPGQPRPDFFDSTCSGAGEWSPPLPRCLPQVCETPEMPENLSFEREAGANASTTLGSGSVIRFRCKEGYQVRFGVHSATCMSSGRWSARPPNCERIKCRHPGLVTNGEIVSPIGAASLVPEFFFAESVVFRCLSGFRFCSLRNDTIRLTCLEDSSWSASMPKCCPVECFPENATNAEFSAERFFFGQQINYTCAKDHVLVAGDLRQTCQMNGRFSGQPPNCSLFKCELPPAPVMAYVTAKFASNLSAVSEFACQKGYRAKSGNTRRLCTAAGLTGKPLICEAVKCPRPEGIGNGSLFVVNKSLELSEFDFGSIARYTCNPGFFVAYGNQSRVCQSDGQWSDLAPTCRPLECPTLARPDNCELVVAGNTLNATAEYRCFFGYRIRNIALDKYANTHVKRVCTASGAWDKVEPVCELIRCPEPREVSNGAVSSTCRTFGCQANVTCKENFDLILGDSIRHCNASGQWSGDEPICDKKVLLCHLTPPNDYVSYKVDSLLVNSVVNYSCWEGFELVEGNLERVCLPNTSWSGVEPRCLPKCCPPPVKVPNAVISVVSDPYPQYKYSFGTIISYRCMPGFSMIGASNTKKCLVNKTWLGAEISCKEKSIEQVIDMHSYNKNKSVSKAMGAIAISFLLSIYGVLIVVDIRWPALYRFFQRIYRRIRTKLAANSPSSE